METENEHSWQGLPAIQEGTFGNSSRGGTHAAGQPQVGTLKTWVWTHMPAVDKSDELVL